MRRALTSSRGTALPATVQAGSPAVVVLRPAAEPVAGNLRAALDAAVTPTREDAA
jgi:hypothetical protein